jgi:type VI secretion system protein VasJ
VRGEPTFEALETEVRKLETSGPNAVDWAAVARMGEAILRDESKDLLVATWLAQALFIKEKLPGLAVGLSIIAGLCDQHWEGMQPPVARERARVGVVEWLVGRVAPALADVSLSEADWPAAIAAYDALLEVDRLASEKLKKEQISIGDLMKALRPLRDTARRGFQEKQDAIEKAARDAIEAAQREAENAQRAEAEAAERAQREAEDAARRAAEPVAPAPAPVTASVAVAASAGPAPAAVVAGDIASLVEQAPASLRAMAEHIRAANGTDARAYALAGLGAWYATQAQGPEQWAAAVQALPADRKSEAVRLAGTGQMAEAVSALENLLADAPFWLDGHRALATALSTGGASAAAMAVGGRAGFLAAQIPTEVWKDPARALMFASGDTLAWLRATFQLGAGEIDAIALDQARLIMGQTNWRVAVTSLARVAEQAATPRDRLRVQLAQAEFCIEVNAIGPALGVLNHVDAAITGHKLESYEPSLCVKGAELRYRALTHYDAPNHIAEDLRRQLIAETQLRLTRLDLHAAVRTLMPG